MLIVKVLVVAKVVVMMRLNQKDEVMVEVDKGAVEL
jgi:type IV secretory pathway component VirB8